MFDGEIICISKFGQGTNFVFIVALTQIADNEDSSNLNNRIMNPIQKNYEKIKIPTKRITSTAFSSENAVTIKKR